MDNALPVKEGGGQKNMKPEKTTPKFFFAFASFAGIVLSMSPLPQYFSQGISLSVLLFAIGAGLLVVVGVVEDFLAARSYFEFEGLKYAVGLVAALVVYLARRDGLDDVNGIFHIDPGALPMTVWAATALNLMWLLFVALTLAGLGSGWVLFRNSKKDEGKSTDESARRKNTLHWNVVRPKFMAFAVLLVSIIGVVSYIALLDQAGRRQKLYMIALTTDFNSDFACEGADTRGTVGLFIGPEQRKVLLAPRYIEGPGPAKPFAFPKKDIPGVYPVIDCIPPKVDLAKWKVKYGIKDEEEHANSPLAVEK